MRCAEALVKALELEGVRYVFGHPGHGNTNILDAIYDSSQIEFMLTRHEQGAAHIADGYARISGEIGVCCASVGPGPANMVMGLGFGRGGLQPGSSNIRRCDFTLGWARPVAGDKPLLRLP